MRARRHPSSLRLLRTMALGWVLHFKMLSRSPFDVMSAAVWPLVYATLAYFLFRGEAGSTAGLLTASLGATVMGIWSVTTVAAAGSLQAQRRLGVLELLVTAPAPFWSVVLPITIAVSTVGIYALGSTLLYGRLFFGIPVEIDNWAAFVIAIPPTIISIGMLGFVLSSALVRFRAAWAIGNMFEYPVWIVCSLLIPITVLPGWAEPISWTLAPTWGTRAIRAAAFGGSPWLDIAMCAVLSLAYLAIGTFSLHFFLRSARRNATLSLS